MSKRDLISIFDLRKAEIDGLIKEAVKLKKEKKRSPPLKGKTLAMIFEKSSTRTRISFEVGMYQLGGTALFLNSNDLQLSRGETIRDTARTMSRYVDAIMLRTFAHDNVIQLADAASVPVINGLSDLSHPCQILSDLLTVYEKKGDYKKLTYAYIGDGNNVLNSWLEAAGVLGIKLNIATPESHKPPQAVLKKAMAMSPESITLCNTPVDAVRNADVVYTDVWVSMGQENVRMEKLKAFEGFQINGTLLQHAGRDAIVMHCLPAHRGEEITSEVLDGRQSVVFDQAENRLHMQKAILKFLIK
ncbi:MAG: ornithine carbamoyltransferase [Deltaproteobacteria bacterium]|nr:ornithine carbamoyltransferase [Deltaproteobacteria bacterium]MCL5878624.1 ornithine carbamoyltransferase [Deltaproteobacteria bacterium]